jgi:hypothetical protein
MSTAIIVHREPPSLAGLIANPPVVFLHAEKARDRSFGFLTANIRNKNSRRRCGDGASLGEYEKVGI